LQDELPLSDIGFSLFKVVGAMHGIRIDINPSLFCYVHEPSGSRSFSAIRKYRKNGHHYICFHTESVLNIQTNFFFWMAVCGIVDVQNRDNGARHHDDPFCVFSGRTRFSNEYQANREMVLTYMWGLGFWDYLDWRMKNSNALTRDPGFSSLFRKTRTGMWKLSDAAPGFVRVMNQLSIEQHFSFVNIPQRALVDEGYAEYLDDFRSISKVEEPNDRKRSARNYEVRFLMDSNFSIEVRRVAMSAFISSRQPNTHPSQSIRLDEYEARSLRGKW
jgi:hypothetical protein